MTQTQEFDPHAEIRKLAEAELCNVCLHPKDKMIEEIIVPFAALRVPCDKLGRVHYAHSGLEQGVPFEICPGWSPEPDVEKACWQVWKLLPFGTKQHLPLADTWEEVVIRAGLAWLEEQHGYRV